jgi:hypothetical protein
MAEDEAVPRALVEAVVPGDAATPRERTNDVDIIVSLMDEGLPSSQVVMVA